MTADRAASALAERGRVGLCFDCRFAKKVVSSRGSAFWLCGRAVEEPRYTKYPRLPVLRCAGATPHDPAPTEAGTPNEDSD